MKSQSLNSADNISTASQNDINVPEWLNQFEVIKRASIEKRDIFLLGVTTVIGGQFNDWIVAYEGGFWAAFFVIFLSIVGYVMLTCCLAEMTSALPFSGGIYGFVRAFSFAHLGFVIACFEMVVNIFYASTNVIALAELLQFVLGGSKGAVLGYCVLIYLLILSICLIGGKVFWAVNTLVGSVSLALILIFIFGSVPSCDFERWAAVGPLFQASSAIKYLGPGSSIFLGIQFLPLTSKCAKDPKSDIPQTMIFSIVFLSLTALGLLVTVASQSPGIDVVKSDLYPLNYGFGKIFNLSYKQATCLSIPGLFGSTFGFLFCYGRQSHAMARSGFLPSICMKTIPFFGTPYVTLLIGCFISLFFNVIFCYYDRALVDKLFDTCVLCGFMCFFGAFIAYLQFHRKYSSLARSFTSPFGDFGAYLGILIFTLGIIGNTLYHGYFQVCFIAMYTIICLIIFHYCLQQNQIFSEEEKQELFKAYLINANLATRDRILKKKKQIIDSGGLRSHPNSKNMLSRGSKSKSNQHAPFSFSQQDLLSRFHPSALMQHPPAISENVQPSAKDESNQELATPEESPDDSPVDTVKMTEHTDPNSSLHATSTRPDIEMNLNEVRQAASTIDEDNLAETKPPQSSPTLLEKMKLKTNKISPQ